MPQNTKRIVDDVFAATIAADTPLHAPLVGAKNGQVWYRYSLALAAARECFLVVTDPFGATVAKKIPIPGGVQAVFTFDWPANMVGSADPDPDLRNSPLTYHLEYTGADTLVNFLSVDKLEGGP